MKFVSQYKKNYEVNKKIGSSTAGHTKRFRNIYAALYEEKSRIYGYALCRLGTCANFLLSNHLASSVSMYRTTK